MGKKGFKESDLIAKVCTAHSDRQTSNYATDMTAPGATDVLQKTAKLMTPYDCHNIPADCAKVALDDREGTGNGLRIFSCGFPN